jgi:hypothetical protein
MKTSRVRSASRSMSVNGRPGRTRRPARLARVSVILSSMAILGGSFIAPVAAAGATDGATTVQVAAPNVDVSRRQGNESETTVAVNPTNPQNVVIASNVAGREPGMFEGVSFDGGATWTTKIVGNGDALGFACCDPSLSFDESGNLFFTYLIQGENLEFPPMVPVALSTDGGVTFRIIATIAKPPGLTGTILARGANGRGVFRYVDQPTITTGAGSAWVVFNAGGSMVASGAPVLGFGVVGDFMPAELAPGTSNCSYGDVAVGPAGQVLQVCQKGQAGQGDGKLFLSLDPDGLGPKGFGPATFVTQTHVGGFDYIPPQQERSVDAESGLAWDRTNGPHGGRVYLLYTNEQQNESDNLDVMVRTSDDQGAHWSAPVRVNDDATASSQFLPKISLDPTTGNLAVAWHDARQDLGDLALGDTDGVPNDDAELWGAFSTNGGASFSANVRISAGVSNATDSGNNIDYGDYIGLCFFGGIAHPAWADNSNSTENNPDGTLHQLDIYTAAVPLTS